MILERIYVQMENSKNMLPLDEDGSGGGGAADNLVQTTLDGFGELMIADTTHSEILSMSIQQRYRWYKKITLEEKDEAMRIVDVNYRTKISGENNPAKRHEVREKISKGNRGRIPWNKGKTGIYSEETRQKISKSLTGRKVTEETRRKLSEAGKGRQHSDETRAKMSKAQKGKNHPMFGKKHSPETRQRMSESLKERWDSGEFDTIDYKQKISDAMTRNWAAGVYDDVDYTGSNHPNWQGGKSFEPYCPKFNYSLKEMVRNEHGRVCALCEKSEIQNGKRLTVHHIDGNKMQGCDSPWYLTVLCLGCHNILTAARGQKAIELEFVLVTNAEEYKRE